MTDRNILERASSVEIEFLYLAEERSAKARHEPGEKACVAVTGAQSQSHRMSNRLLSQRRTLGVYPRLTERTAG
jgi:hypothetical protein